MSAATIDFSRDPRTRYEGGFDRWSFEARSGWAILWHGSDHAAYALGEHQTVWIWDEGGRIWTRLSPDEAATVYRNHEITMRRLRRAVLVVKLLTSKVAGEREAARAALQRIGSAISSDWEITQSGAYRGRSVSWFDHPAAVYLAVTHDCRFHLRERERMPFDPGVFAELVAVAQEDFTAGRRPEPPRLRPADLVYLQASMPRADHHAESHAAAGESIEAMNGQTSEPDPADQAESDRISTLREAVADAVQRELSAEEAARRSRRRLWLISGSVAASLVLILALAGIS